MSPVNFDHKKRDTRPEVNPMSNIKQLKEEHKGEWLAIAVTDRTTEGPTEGELLSHATDRAYVWKTIRDDPRHIYVTFAGPMLKEGYAAAF